MRRFPTTALVLATVCLAAQQAGAQKLLTPSAPNPPTTHEQPSVSDRAVKDIRPSGTPIRVNVSQGTMLRLPVIPATVFVADSEIADAVVQPQPPDAILLKGKSAGRTTLYAVDEAGNVLLNAAIEVTGGPVTIIRGAAVSAGPTPPGPIILTIPLQPVAPTAK